VGYSISRQAPEASKQNPGNETENYDNETGEHYLLPEAIVKILRDKYGIEEPIYITYKNYTKELVLLFDYLFHAIPFEAPKNISGFINRGRAIHIVISIHPEDNIKYTVYNSVVYEFYVSYSITYDDWIYELWNKRSGEFSGLLSILYHKFKSDNYTWLYLDPYNWSFAIFIPLKPPSELIDFMWAYFSNNGASELFLVLKNYNDTRTRVKENKYSHYPILSIELWIPLVFLNKSLESGEWIYRVLANETLFKRYVWSMILNDVIEADRMYDDTYIGKILLKKPSGEYIEVSNIVNNTENIISTILSERIERVYIVSYIRTFSREWRYVNSTNIVAIVDIANKLIPKILETLFSNLPRETYIETVSKIKY